MKKYKVLLTRSYVVTINANNENEALRLSEFYIGGEGDISNTKDKEIDNYDIVDIEMTVNEAFKVEEEIEFDK